MYAECWRCHQRRPVDREVPIERLCSLCIEYFADRVDIAIQPALAVVALASTAVIMHGQPFQSSVEEAVGALNGLTDLRVVP